MVFSEQMKDGYRAALEKHHLRFDDRLARHCSFRIEEAYQTTMTLLAEQPDITAILAGSGEIARGCIRVAYETGRTIPADISLVNFGEQVDDGRFGGFVTHVRQHIEEIGIKATEKLLKQITEKEVKLTFDQLPTELVLGSSCATAGPSPRSK
jgi:DNA-binding LacI/PurR family transcriptional regulator